MTEHLKVAYAAGVEKALYDWGISKEAGLPRYLADLLPETAPGRALGARWRHAGSIQRGRPGISHHALNRMDAQELGDRAAALIAKYGPEDEQALALIRRGRQSSQRADSIR